ncbi:MAG TPA: phosphatidylserine decarboxylase [Verrucomicrobiae bacterium]|jgi:phosphatidylserine decarboxylase|nr:phosphatidylserine decarboxylase [Verrucomicrobiae bacterium]
MKHAGEARRAGFKIIGWTLIAICVMAVMGFLGKIFAEIMMGLSLFLFFVWVLLAIFTLYFFRDPEARVPATPRRAVAPGHGKVDLIDQCHVPFLGGPCHRISIFLSVIDIHVQNAPVAGKVTLLTHTAGQFLSAINSDCSNHNENVLIGFDSTEVPNERIALRLIAGLIARRIVPFVKLDDVVARGERISLIQFGSRCDLYLPLDYQIMVKLGDHVVGGETIMAAKP